MLQLYILTKDRPEKLRIALNSALNQDYKNIEIIVSDNSEELTTSKMMHADFNNVNYIKRTPPTSSHVHFVTVIEEATADFIMLFHDDDILKNTHVSNILLKFKLNPDLVGVASNGTFFGDTLLNNRGVMVVKNEVLIKSPLQLFEHYLGLHPSGSSPAPFPSYIYRTSILKKANIIVDECGKHRDVKLLTKILDYGHILWLPTSTIYYRIHTAQDSSIENINDRNKLLNFMNSNGIDLKSKSVRYFKFMYLFRWWKSSNKNILRMPKGIKERVVAKFLFCSFLYLFFRSTIFLKKIFGLTVFVIFKKVR